MFFPRGSLRAATRKCRTPSGNKTSRLGTVRSSRFATQPAASAPSPRFAAQYPLGCLRFITERKLEEPRTRRRIVDHHCTFPLPYHLAATWRQLPATSNQHGASWRQPGATWRQPGATWRQPGAPWRQPGASLVATWRQPGYPSLVTWLPQSGHLATPEMPR